MIGLRMKRRDFLKCIPFAPAAPLIAEKTQDLSHLEGQHVSPRFETTGVIDVGEPITSMMTCLSSKHGERLFITHGNTVTEIISI